VTDRRQRLLLAVIAAVGLLRGMWWVVVTPIWSPIDEQAHYDFVEAMGRLEAPPIVGEDRVHREVLELAKRSSTSPWQSVPVPADPSRLEWHAYAQSYEAAQPPLYYAAMAPVWKAASWMRTLGTVYVLRVASLVLSLLLVPLLWLLGRELFPDRPEIGVGAAAVAVVLSGVNGNFAIVANDGAMTVLCAATTLAVARLIQRGFTSRRVVMLGLLVALAVLTKLTALSIVGIVAIGALLAARRHRVSRRELARHGAVAGGAAAALAAPWVLFNLIAYGGVTGSKQLDAITGSLQSDPPLNLGGLATRLRQAGHGFWDQQLLDTTVSRYSWLWFGFALVVGVAALIRRRDERSVLAWLFGAWPLAFLTMTFVILGLSGGRSDIAGRHLYVALPAVLVAVVAATRLVAGRWAFAVLAAICAVGLTFEARDAPAISRAIYSAGAFGNLTPVVDHAYADRLIAGKDVTFDSPCPAVAVRFVFRDAAPTLRINGVLTEPFTPEPGEGRTVAALYAVDGAPRRIAVALGAEARVAASAGIPAYRVYCVDRHNYDARFAQAFRRGHPPLTATQVAMPPRLWAIAGWIAVLIALTRNIGRWGRSDNGSRASRSLSAAAS
jgi:hypothetical protein